MASPKYITFLVTDNTGTPITGIAGSLTFTAYKDSSGTNLSQPSFVELGGGVYGFIPTFPDPTKGTVFTVNTAASHYPSYVSGYVRPEDYFPDEIDMIRKIQTNKWKVDTGTNQFIIYDDDGTTPYLVFDLKDSAGAPTSSSPFSRVPH